MVAQKGSHGKFVYLPKVGWYACLPWENTSIVGVYRGWSINTSFSSFSIWSNTMTNPKQHMFNIFQNFQNTMTYRTFVNLFNHQVDPEGKNWFKICIFFTVFVSCHAQKLLHGIHLEISIMYQIMKTLSVLCLEEFQT